MKEYNACFSSMKTCLFTTFVLCLYLTIVDIIKLYKHHYCKAWMSKKMLQYKIIEIQQYKEENDLKS